MMTERLPLSALLSQLLVVFTIEFDNEFELRMRASGHPGYLSMGVWLNFLRFLLPEGMSIREFAEEALISPKDTYLMLGALERWRFVDLVHDPTDPRPPRTKMHNATGVVRRAGFGSGGGLSPYWIVRPMPRTVRAFEIWPLLFAEIEARWQTRFGKDIMADLIGAARDVLDHVDAPLPQGLPGGLLPAATGASARRTVGPASLSLPVLVSRILWMFACDFDRQSPVPITLGANLLRVLDDEGARIAELPRLTGLSPPCTRIGWELERSGLIEVVHERTARRQRVVRLTAKGAEAKRSYIPVAAAIEKQWTAKFGRNLISRLRASLEAVLEQQDADGRYRLIEGLVTPPGLPRSGARSGDCTPHLTIGWPGAAKERDRQLVAQTAAFIEDPHNALPHFPVWHGDRGVGP